MHPDHVRKNLLAARIVRAHLKKRFRDRDKLLEGGLGFENGHPISAGTDGYILLSVAVADLIREYTGRSWELVLANVPERNEQLFSDPYEISWSGILDQVLATAQDTNPGSSDVMDVPTAMVSGFSFAVSINAQWAKLSRQTETKTLGVMIEWLEQQPGGR